jgi:hypothetical protein
MAKREKLDPGKLSAIIDTAIADARDFDSSDRALLRDKALKYLKGETDIALIPGRSQVVSRDVSDTLGLIMPGLMRAFLATDRVAQYEATKPKKVTRPKKDDDGNPVVDPQSGQPAVETIDQNEEFAGQATDYVNYVVLRECDGYRQIRSAIHDGLALGNGILKYWWDSTPEYTTERFTGLTDDAYYKLLNDDEVEEVLEHDEYPAGDADYLNPGDGEPSAEGYSGGGAGGTDLPQAVAAPQATVPGLDVDGNGGSGGEEFAQGFADGLSGAPPKPLDGELLPPLDAGMLHDCKVKRVCSYGRLKLMAIPPEDFGIDSNATTLDEEHVTFCYHLVQKTRSQLIKEGYDREKVEDLSASQGRIDNNADDARDSRRSLFNINNTKDKSTDLIDIYECYICVDYDGDGVAEWRRVIRAGEGGNEDSILENEEWGDDLPFADIVPDPVPHRWRGNSVFDETKDVQDVKTVLMRGTLDNLYQNNNPRQIVKQGAVLNPDSLINWTIGDVTFVTGDNAVVPLVVPFVADKSFAVLEYMDQIVEKRTGISRASMALDPDALQNQTATATNQATAAAHTKVEEYARNIAECGGLRRTFDGCLKLIVKNQDQKRTIRLRDEWVEMDPSAWNAKMDVTVNTGLGTGSRDRDVAMLQGVAQKQEMVIQTMGPANELVPVDILFATYRKLAEAAGLKNPDQYFPEIGQDVIDRLKAQASQTPPDPKLIEIQAKSQAEAQKMQMEAQLKQAESQAKITLEQAQMQREIAKEDRQAQADIMTAQEKLKNDTQMAQLKLEADVQMNQQKFEFQREIELLKLQAEQARADREYENTAKLKVMELAFKARADMQKNAIAQAGVMTAGDADGDDEMKGMLAEHGVEMPAGVVPAPSPMDRALEALVKGQEGQVQLMQQMSERFAAQDDRHVQTLSELKAEMSRPKSQQVHRDPKTNRVIGATIQ